MLPRPKLRRTVVDPIVYILFPSYPQHTTYRSQLQIRIITIMWEAISAFVLSTLSVAYFTNPFSRLTIIRLPYRIRLSELTHRIINQNHKITVHTSALWRLFA